MRTHVLISGQVLGLSNLTKDEQAFYEECLAAYKNNEDHHQFIKRAWRPGNPMLKGGAMITPDIMAEPLYQSIRDLLSRLSMQQGGTLPGPDDDLETGPDAPDSFVTMTEAAESAGVSRPGIYNAIQEGRLLAYQDEQGRWMVSKRSLDRYAPNRKRQLADRLGGLK